MSVVHILNDWSDITRHFIEMNYASCLVPTTYFSKKKSMSLNDKERGDVWLLTFSPKWGSPGIKFQCFKCHPSSNQLSVKSTAYSATAATPVLTSN